MSRKLLRVMHLCHSGGFDLLKLRKGTKWWRLWLASAAARCGNERESGGGKCRDETDHGEQVGFFLSLRTGFHMKTGPFSRRLLRRCLIGWLGWLRSCTWAARSCKKSGCTCTGEDREFQDCHSYMMVAFVRNHQSQRVWWWSD